MNLRESWRTMRSMLYLLVLLTILYFADGSPTNYLIPPDMKPATFGLTGRIVNGTKAVLRQFPHQVSLMRSWSEAHFCGGNLISASLVLTAGHCMFINCLVNQSIYTSYTSDRLVGKGLEKVSSSGNLLKPWMIIVVGGIVRLDDDGPTRQGKYVTNIRLHPKYDEKTLHNDIAVLKLLKPFTFTPEVHSVSLPSNAYVPNAICQVSGWGYLSPSIPIVSPDLMYVDLPIRSVKECRSLLKNETDVPAGMFCAGWLKGGRDACQGDSGGGMVCNGVLTGTVSGGIGCALPLLPGIYTDVFHYLNWILNDTDAIVKAQSNFRNYGNDNFENYGTSNTASIIDVIISFLFCAVINCT